MAEGSRTAFQVFPALTHRSSQSVISAIAVDDDGEHVYVGTSDGQLEEHRVHGSGQGVRVSLGARKHVGKKVLTHAHLPSQPVMSWCVSYLTCKVMLILYRMQHALRVWVCGMQHALRGWQ